MKQVWPDRFFIPAIFPVEKIFIFDIFQRRRKTRVHNSKHDFQEQRNKDVKQSKRLFVMNKDKPIFNYLFKYF